MGEERRRLISDVKERLDEIKRGEFKLDSPGADSVELFSSSVIETLPKEITDYLEAADKLLEINHVQMATLYVCAAALAVIVLAKIGEATTLLQEFKLKVEEPKSVVEQPMWRILMFVLHAILDEAPENMVKADFALQTVDFPYPKDREFIMRMFRFLHGRYGPSD